MRIFFHALVKKLDAEDRHWHRNTIIMADNASYHTCPATLNVFEELGITILFTGPHSYSASPVELMFAAFKRRDINQHNLPVGKKVSPPTFISLYSIFSLYAHFSTSKLMSFTKLTTLASVFITSKAWLDS